MCKKIAMLCSILCAIVLCVMLSVTALATNTTDEPQELVIGCVIDAGMIQSPVTRGAEGYGYEYLQQIIGYTQGDYTLTFVECTLDEAYNLLQSGEIDLFGLTNYDEAWAEEGFVYTEHDLGNNLLFLTSMSDISIDANTYEKLEGATIGSVVDTAYVESFLQTYGRSANVIQLVDDDYVTAFEEYDLDFCVVSSFSFPSDNEINVLSQIDVVPVYLVASEENQDVIDDFDIAISKIEKTEYSFQETLYSKYYATDIDINTYISAEEYDYIQSQEIYYVGLRDLSGPFSYRNAQGEWDGVGIDFLTMLESAAGITLEIVEIDINTSEAELAQLDFYLFADWEDGSTQSETYLSAPLILVNHNESIASAQTVGVLRYYGFNSVNEGETILEREVVQYDDLDQLVAAMNSGAVESIIVSTATLNYIRSDLDDQQYLSTALDATFNLSMTYSADFDAEKIAIFDKVILNLDSAALEYSLLENSSKETSVSFTELIANNPALLVGAIVSFLFLVGIMDERRRRAIARNNNYDSVTGIYTKNRFQALVQEQLRLYGRKNNYRMISVDIDNFKYINEIYGYTVGTQVLKCMCAITKQRLPKDAIFSRVYADNFLIFTRQTASISAVQQYIMQDEEMNEALSRVLGTLYRFSFSVGYYDVPEGRVSVDYMIDCANVARELGKDSVFTSVHKFSEEINIERARNNEIVAHMEQAIDTGEFVLFYQPKVDLETERLVGAEALVRWNRNGRVVAPNHFIPLFEKNGFIQRLDFEVLDMACAFIAKHENAGVPKISVNLSGITMAREGLVKEINAVLAKYGVQPSRIDLEITETAFAGNDVAQKIVTDLEVAGYSISMDDFGVGISSLSRLKSLEIDTLKIDRMFIIDYLTNDKGAVILKNILNMANALGVETVAEGIETREQLETLRRYGCDVGQGYFFSRPVPEAEFLRFCEKDKAQ